jgi:hypothetical protein
MNKIGLRVIAHAASLQRHGRIVNLGSRDFRNSNIKQGHVEGMKRMVA